MARIAGADPKRQGWLSGLFTRVVCGMSKRKLGHIVAPVQITAGTVCALPVRSPDTERATRV